MTAQAGRRGAGGWLLGVFLMAVLVACQPVEDVEPSPEGQAVEAEDAESGPLDIGAVEESLDDTATEWDSDATLVEMAVRPGPDRHWTELRSTHLAPDADRMLILRHDGTALSEEEATLDTLGFHVLDDAALAVVPALPDDVVDPASAATAAAEAPDGCGMADEPHEILYTTGAPGAWDGSGWAQEPRWTVTVLGEGGGVLLDIDGALRSEPCIDLP